MELVQKTNPDGARFANSVWEKIKDETNDFNNTDIISILGALAENHSLLNYGYFVRDCLAIIEKMKTIIFPEDYQTKKLTDQFFLYFLNSDNNEYTVDADLFINLWKFTGKQSWVNIYADHMKKWKHQNFKETIALCEATRNNLLIETLDTHILPTVTDCNEQLVFLFEWAERNGVIFTSSINMDKMWENIAKRNLPDKDFTKLPKYFQK